MRTDITYSNIAEIFSQFKTDDQAQQALIGAIIQLSAAEIDEAVWGELAKPGLFFLVACRLSNLVNERTQQELGQATLKIVQELGDPKTLQNQIGLLSSETVEKEYRVEYDNRVLVDTLRAMSELFESNKTSSKNQEENFYCQEYRRLQEIVGFSLLYSG